jgi:hypothetical protein
MSIRIPRCLFTLYARARARAPKEERKHRAYSINSPNYLYAEPIHSRAQSYYNFITLRMIYSKDLDSERCAADECINA